MIGKYKDEDFILELTANEQREYLQELIKEMTNDEIIELIHHINDVRSKVIDRIFDEGEYQMDNIISHFF